VEPVVAASTLGVAAIAAGASLLGGVLGAVGGGVADYVLEKRRQSATGRAAARLLRAELSGCARTLRNIEATQVWQRFHVVETPSWDKYRNELALILRSDDWTVVEYAVTSLSHWATGLTRIGTLPAQGTKLDDVTGLSDMRERMRLAYNALSGLAEGTSLSANEFGLFT
jgi:hypothetical protein